MNTTNAASFAALLSTGDMGARGARELHRQARRLVLPLLVTTALLVTWSAAAPLSGAIVAAGHLKAELNRKTVQHQEGGIVRSILVKNGQRVRAGQPLIVIGDVRSDAELSLLQDQLHAERIRAARAAAEAALENAFALPHELTVVAPGDSHYARERALFEARRRTLDEHITSLQAQIGEAQRQAEALQMQIEASEQSAALSAQELALNEKLAREGYVQRARMLQLQRAEADYRSRIGENRSEHAAARQRSGELRARIAQARNQYQQQATDELKTASAKIRELEERLRPSQDQVERQYVRAPVDGEVMSMRVAAVGEVIGPRDPLLDIVPAREKLVIEARIRPQDITHVRQDIPAEVRLSAFDARTTPLLPSTVVFVSPDRVTAPETGDSWYIATVEVDAAALQNHPDIRLQAGMPAELFVTTPERTLFEYLAKPLNAFASRAMREP